MTVVEYLLVCLAEECAEIQQAATKALRFGLDDSPPDGARPTTNAEEIRHELTDLMAVASMLVQYGAILPGFDYERAAEKRAKVLRFMDYSRGKGTLE